MLRQANFAVNGLEHGDGVAGFLSRRVGVAGLSQPVTRVGLAKSVAAPRHARQSGEGVRGPVVDDVSLALVEDFARQDEPVRTNDWPQPSIKVFMDRNHTAPGLVFGADDYEAAVGLIGGQANVFPAQTGNLGSAQAGESADGDVRQERGHVLLRGEKQALHGLRRVDRGVFARNA